MASLGDEALLQMEFLLHKTVEIDRQIGASPTWMESSRIDGWLGSSCRNFVTHWLHLQKSKQRFTLPG